MPSKRAGKVSVPRRCKAGSDRFHPVYELDLWLVDSEPLIWRSLVVPANFTLEMLHVVIQIAMGWQEMHLHRFESKSHRRFEPRTQAGGVDAIWATMFDDGQRAEDESGIELHSLFAELKERLAYLYDFGDGWLHGIKLIGTHADASAFEHLPMCLAGRRAAPPEDSGGIGGYEEKLAILKDPDPGDGWHQDVIEWMGGRDFDPDAFDARDVNALLARCFGRRPGAAGRRTERCAFKRRRRTSR